MKEKNIYSKESIRKIGYIMLVYQFLSAFALALPQSYVSYSFTDLHGISPTLMSTCLLIVNTIAVVITVISGAFVQKTKSKFGQYRPWILFTPFLTMVGGLLMFLNYGSSPLLNAVLISAGYLFASSSMDFIFTARSGIITNIARDDSSNRTLLSGRSWQGGAIGYIVSGAAVLPLVVLLGGTANMKAFFCTQLILCVLVWVGSFVMFKYSADYDPSNIDQKEKVEENKVNFFDMLKGVLANKNAVMLLLSDITRFTGYYVLFTMMVYQCSYVIGNMMAMSYVLSASNFGAFIGATLAPVVSEKLGGRKKTALIFSALTGGSAVLICFFGKTLWGFVIPCTLYFFFMSFIDTIDVPMYFDAGEYWLHKTGKDTRAYIVSMYNVAVKIAIALSAVMLGAVLNLINYTPGMELDAHGATALTMATGLSPAIGYLLPILFLLIYNISDKDAPRYIKENAEKYGTKE